MSKTPAAAKPAKKTSQIKEISGDTWAASGGTAGIFGPGVRSGRIKIVED